MFICGSASNLRPSILDTLLVVGTEDDAAFVGTNAVRESLQSNSRANPIGESHQLDIETHNRPEIDFYLPILPLFVVVLLREPPRIQACTTVLSLHCVINRHRPLFFLGSKAPRIHPVRQIHSTNLLSSYTVLEIVLCNRDRTTERPYHRDHRPV